MTLLLLIVAVPAWAADGLPVPYEGRLITAVIDEFRADGYSFAYSTVLVSSDLVVQAEPSAGSPLEVVKQILQPHGLKIRSDSGVHLVVRDTSSKRSSAAMKAITRRPFPGGTFFETCHVG